MANIPFERARTRVLGIAALLAIAAMVLTACEALQIPQVAIPRPGDIHHGEPIDAVARPDAATCDHLLRAEVDVAVTIRGLLNDNTLRLDRDAAAAIAADPDAVIVSWLGIPMRRDELPVLETSGSNRDMLPSAWVQDAAPERFGGIWVDPPGSDDYVVAIPPADGATRRLARCLETDGMHVRYVAAAMTLAQADAIRDQIRSDMPLLAGVGIDVVSLGYAQMEAVVEIGVKEPTDAMRVVTRIRYGPSVRVVEVPEFVDVVDF